MPLDSVSVVITSFRRAWALQYSLHSLMKQTRMPDEVVIVLKPSGDKSEEIIKEFSKDLPIKLVIQNKGFVVEAIDVGIKNAQGDIILFLDDDAVGKEDFVSKYLSFFQAYNDAGGASGITLRAYLRHGVLQKTHDHYHPQRFQTSVRIPKYCKPLNVFAGYQGWISKSGALYSLRSFRRKLTRNALLHGANMGFVGDLIRDCPLRELFKNSRKGYSFESMLAYWVRIKGYHTYVILDEEISPTVWHIIHKDKLTFAKDFWDDFWFSYDALKNYWRYKKMGADVSFRDYFLFSIAFIRRNISARVPAFFYTLLDH